MTGNSRGLGLVSAIWVLGGCGGGDRPPTAWASIVDTVGDTIVVRTTAGSVWGDTAFLEPDVSIGMLDGPDEYLIGDPRSIAVDRRGIIYLLDRQVPIVRTYGRDGRHVRDVGREGGGPGEYKSPGAIAVLPDRRLLVRDPANARISVFNPKGDYVGQVRWPGGFNTSRRMYVDTAGFAYSLILLNPGTPPWEWQMGLARIDADTGVVDTVPAPTWDHEPARLTASREGSSSSSRVPFTGQPTWTFSPLGYMVGGVTSEYRIDLVRPAGRWVRVERSADPIPVQPDEEDEQRRRITTNMRRNYPGWRWNGPDVPAVKPPYKTVIISEEGNLWVHVSQIGRPTMTEAEARDEEERTDRVQIRYREDPAFDVFAADGRFLGAVRVPPTFRTTPEPIIRGDTVWAVVSDELDVASVVRFLLVHPREQTDD